MSDNFSLTVKNCYEIEDDFQNIFLLKSGINIVPKYKELKLSERTNNEIHFDDLYIIEPGKFYYIDFYQNISDKNVQNDTYLDVNEAFCESGILVFPQFLKGEGVFYLYNATRNLVYLQKGMKVAEVIKYG